MERGNIVEKELVSNLLVTVLKQGQLCLLQVAPVHSAVNKYLAIDSGGYVNELSLHSNCNMAECFPEKLRW